MLGARITGFCIIKTISKGWLVVDSLKVRAEALTEEFQCDIVENKGRAVAIVYEVRTKPPAPAVIAGAVMEGSAERTIDLTRAEKAARGQRSRKANPPLSCRRNLAEP